MPDDESSELLSILNDGGSDDPDAVSPDQSEAPEPLDGAPPEDADADEPETESDDLSAEERVAALLGEDEETGAAEDEADAVAADDAEPDEDDDEESETERLALIEEGRKAREERQRQEQLAPYAEVYQTAERRIAEAKTHYANERRRIRAAVMADAQRNPEPEVYIEANLDAALEAAIEAENAWIAGIGKDAREQVQAIREKQSRPAWAAELAKRRGLPQDAIAKILEVESPREMAKVADLLVEFRSSRANERRRTTLKNRDEKARLIAANQVHSPPTGRAPAPREVELTGSEDELVAILNYRR